MLKSIAINAKTKRHGNIYLTCSRLMSTGNRSKYLIETAELQELIDSDSPNLKIINGSFYPGCLDELLTKRITRDTVHFDIEKVAGPNAELPVTFPTLEFFKFNMMQLGIQKTDQIICYDADPLGVKAVCRVAWILRYYGAPSVRILNGGYKKWVAEGRQIQQGKEESTQEMKAGDYSYEIINKDSVIMDIDHMHGLAGKLDKADSHDSLDFQIIDTRFEHIWSGMVDNPNRRLRRGGIKNSINLPFNMLINEDGTFKSDEDLLAIFKRKGIDVNKHTVNSCQTGVTACISDFALRLLGNETAQLYDGSWSEYGAVDEPYFGK